MPAEVGEPPAPEELIEWEADLARLKEILDRQGPVNLLAAEEFTQQDERHRSRYQDQLRTYIPDHFPVQGVHGYAETRI